MNKKSKIYFTVLFMLLFVSVFIPYALNISFSKKGKFDKYIGESQLHLIKTYETGEVILFYIDQGARAALKQAISNLGLTQTDFNRQKINKTKKRLLPEFQNNFLKITDNFPETKIPIIIDEYEFNLKRKGNSVELLGKYSDILKLEIRTDNKIVFTEAEIIKGERLGYYLLNPSFRETVAIT
ncbi:hypothetical protein GF327_06855 [Candidatus Woesearchaeota archaeon]|nr:hypothetical protein [Candidatus Woesearchaeota archaeon]